MEWITHAEVLDADREGKGELEKEKKNIGTLLIQEKMSNYSWNYLVRTPAFD